MENTLSCSCSRGGNAITCECHDWPIYQIQDLQTKSIVATYPNQRRKASLRADRLNNIYGAHRYAVVLAN